MVDHNNRIFRFVERPASQPGPVTEESPRTHKGDDDEEDEEDEEAPCDEEDEESDDSDDSEDEEDEEDAGLFDSGDDDGGDGDGDDDGDDSEDSPEDFIRSKVMLAMEDAASLAFGRAIIHEDPHDEEKLLLTMQIDKFAEDEEMPALDGTEMHDVSLIIVFEGKGMSGPKKRIVALDKLSDLFDESNWKKKPKGKKS